MTVITAIQILSLAMLLAMSAFCSSSETVFFSLNPLEIRRLSREHPAFGKRLHDLMSRPTQLLSTVLILNTLVNVSASALSFSIAQRLVPNYAEPVAIPAMTILLLLFGEYGPKRLGLLLRDRFARWYTPPLLFFMAVLTPLRVALERVTRWFEPFFRPHGRTLSEEEFETVVDISGEEGILDSDELAMIKSIINLENLKAADIMTPRVDLRGLDLEDDPATFRDVVRRGKLHYLLLYRGRVDEVAGFLDVRRYLLDPEGRIEAATLAPMYVPESCPVNMLFSQFQQREKRTAVVVDEYGGVSGIVTRGDILEEISGEIYHELSKPRPIFQPAGPHRWLVDAHFSLEELNRKLRLRLNAEGADRLAGWIACHLGHLPEPNETVEAQGCRVTVLQTDRRRVTLAHLEILEAAP